MQRKENLELSRKNIELDRASRACQKEMMEAQEELEKCFHAQSGRPGAIDEQIAQQLNLCEELRTLAEGQSHRLQSDLKRFSSMKAKLLELLVAASPERQKEDTSAEQLRAGAPWGSGAPHWTHGGAAAA
eukprot:g10971.t1